ncbi:hypothetical protein V8C34DRAFT_292925 [Trichoderma compactum]
MTPLPKLSPSRVAIQNSSSLILMSYPCQASQASSGRFLRIESRNYQLEDPKGEPDPTAIDAAAFNGRVFRFSNFEGTLGLHPGSGGAAWMPLHIGRSRAMEFLLSGEDMDAETAERYGYVDKAFETSEEMHEYVMQPAKRIALLFF